MQTKAKTMANALPAGRGAARGINRLKLWGLAALVTCVAIAAYGLWQEQSSYASIDDGTTRPWTPQR